MHARNKHSSLLDPFVSYEKMECCEYAPFTLVLSLWKSPTVLYVVKLFSAALTRVTNLPSI